MEKKLLTLFTLLVAILTAHAQEVKYIKLKQQVITHTPRQFYIAGVKDARQDTADIGTLKLGMAGKPTKVNLQYGVTSNLQQFTRKYVPRDTTLIPIWLHVEKLVLSERMNKRLQQVDVDVAFSFYKDDNKIMEYSGNGYQQASFDVSGYAGQLIRNTLESSIAQFDDWLGAHKEDVVGAPSVTVNVVLETALEEPELIPYSKGRPLTWADFQGEPDDLSLAAAATYSGISVSSASRSSGSKTIVDIKVSVYFDKSRSWSKAAKRTAKGLQHEQLHFDISAVKACELVEVLRTYTYSPENYDKEIMQLQKQNQKEAKQMQIDYDKQTQHSLIATAQATWVKKVNELLGRAACY